VHVTGLVLAGGASRRMGRNKLDLPVATGTQVTILEHVVRVVASVSDSVTLLVPPQFTDKTWQLPNISVVADEDFYKGPLAALAHGWPAAGVGNVLRQQTSRHKDVATSAPVTSVPGPSPGPGSAVRSVLVVAGDYPGLQATVLSACINQLATASGELVPPSGATPVSRLSSTPSSALSQPPVQGAVLRREGRLQPLIGCYREGVGTLLQEQAANGEYRLMRAVDKLRVVTIDVVDEAWPDWWTRPVHTPADYQDWLHQNTVQGGVEDET
jgi:molybdopterin-guanine dinucleotide biosynthesis protein A